MQLRASRLVQEFRGMSYVDRLKSLDWCTLEERRLRGDMVQVFKLINGFDCAAHDSFFIKSSTCLRGHTFELYKCSFCTDIGKHSFSNRIIDDWNNLPQHVYSIKQFC